VEGSFGSLGAIAVDWDGDHGPHENEHWETGAIVRVGTDPYVDYGASTPAARGWDISCIHGDANNDGAFNNFDVTPFIQAVTDPAGYRSSYPGLSGSILDWPHYRGDLNCDY
jgi:hypothetical protein